MHDGQELAGAWHRATTLFAPEGSLRVVIRSGQRMQLEKELDHSSHQLQDGQLEEAYGARRKGLGSGSRVHQIPIPQELASDFGGSTGDEVSGNNTFSS